MKIQEQNIRELTLTFDSDEEYFSFLKQSIRGFISKNNYFKKSIQYLYDKLFDDDSLYKRYEEFSKKTDENERLSNMN